MDTSTQQDEPEICRNDIFAMLSASGYHRARVVGLDDYDKIVGGITWAIARCDDVAVAANLLYEESEDQNIKLRTDQSEKIISALLSIGCPHRISAHQIFKLDYPVLKNVIQWLLRRILSPKNEGKFRNFTDWFSHKNSNEMAYKEYCRRLRGAKNPQKSVTRHMKRFDKNLKFDLSIDAKCTLAEYTVHSRNGEELEQEAEKEVVEVEQNENLQEASTKKHVPTSTVREMMDQAVVDGPLGSTEPSDGLTDEPDLAQKLTVLENRIVDEETAFYTAKMDFGRLTEQLNRMVDDAEIEGEIDRQQLKDIFDSYKSTELRASELREHVLQDLQKAQAHEDRLRRNVDEFGNVQEYDEHKRELQERYAEKMKEQGEVMKETITLQYQLDGLMGTSLTSHYRKRNMERLQDSSELTQEAKAAVIDYNVTVDILTFSAKINQFVNELEKTLLAQASRPATQEYREAFVAYMNDVRNQLGEYHWKAKLTQDKARAEKDSLSQIRAEIRTKERELLFTTGELKRLLSINKVLQKTIAELVVIEQNSPLHFQNEQVEESINEEMEQLDVGL